jgi:hypothetical protein
MFEVLQLEIVDDILVPLNNDDLCVWFEKTRMA